VATSGFGALGDGETVSRRNMLGFGGILGGVLWLEDMVNPFSEALEACRAGMFCLAGILLVCLGMPHLDRTNESSLDFGDVSSLVNVPCRTIPGFSAGDCVLELPVD